MTNPAIHPTAIVDPGSEIGEGVTIGPYAIVEKGAVVGNHCSIEAHAIIKGEARIGSHCLVGHFSVLGGLPQHNSFDPSIRSYAKIGERVRIGEGVTVHRSIYSGGWTEVGDASFLMGYSHVAHDCKVAKSVVLANGVLLGGHVMVENNAFIGGGAAIHQFIRIGEGAMVGGLSEISRDVSPQITVSGRNLACGLNLIGLKRRNVSAEEISELKKLYRMFLAKPGNLKKRAEDLLGSSEVPKTKLGCAFVEFFVSGERNFARSRSSSIPAEDDLEKTQM